MKRPMANGNEGSTPALGDAQARKLLEAPAADTLKGARDRAILATLLYHGMRREELCGLRVKDMQSRQGVVLCSRFWLFSKRTICVEYTSSPPISCEILMKPHLMSFACLRPTRRSVR